MKLDIYNSSQELANIIKKFGTRIHVNDLYVTAQTYEVFGDNIGDETSFLINIFQKSNKQLLYHAILHKQADFPLFMYLVQTSNIECQLIPGQITERQQEDIL